MAAANIVLLDGRRSSAPQSTSARSSARLKAAADAIRVGGSSDCRGGPLSGPAAQSPSPGCIVYTVLAREYR
eukprot:SAG31_NODE_703_length_12720_cov_10.185088_7_plen_72_part_00